MMCEFGALVGEWEDDPSVGAVVLTATPEAVTLIEEYLRRVEEVGELGAFEEFVVGDTVDLHRE